MSRVIMENYGVNQEALAYDLRQRYAKIVGDHLEDVAEYRRASNYSEYFRALENLYTITQHKFQTGKKKEKSKEEKSQNKKTKDKPSTYESLRTKLIEISNKYINAWQGNGTVPKEVAEIENALRAIEKFIYFKMDEAGMFGSKRDTEGLI